MNEFCLALHMCLVLTISVHTQNVFSQRVNEATKIITRRGVRFRKLMTGVGRSLLTPRKEICYEMVGCFDLPRKHSIKRPPQSPSHLDTRFWLYTRETAKLIPLPWEQILTLKQNAELLDYGDAFESLKNSSFKIEAPTNILIHGFKGSGKDKGVLFGVQEFLKLGDVNVLIVDWERGAADDYQTAVANTELIGRQTSLVLLDMIAKGADVKKMHVVGFSLGAHIAGCIGEILKQRGFKLGRITGLDPASPLFKNEILRESSRKLDSTDADFVDIIHTDGSPVFTEGFGLLKPLGHVDYFPNGGREQPGCKDEKRSVVMSHRDGTLDESIACSHVRAWRLFLETLVRQQSNSTDCQFIGYPCAGGFQEFEQGKCFHKRTNCLPGDIGCNIMGMGTRQDGARGVLYLATRSAAPFCGEEMKISVLLSQNVQKLRGHLYINIKTDDEDEETMTFKVNCNSPLGPGRTLREVGAIAAAKTGLIHPETTPSLKSSLNFVPQDENTNEPTPPVYIDQITLEDQNGNQWHYCLPNTLVPANGAYQLEVQLAIYGCAGG